MKITIDLDEIKGLVQEGRDIFLTPDAENALVKLLDTQAKVEEAIKEVKQLLEQEALKFNENFSSIKSDKVKVYYRSYGSRFGLDESKLNELPKTFYTIEPKIKTNSKEIEKYEKEHENLPDGVIQYDRPKSISISLINNE